MPWSKEKQRAKLEESKRYVREYKENHPCVDCGERDPIVLEFDHREGTKKDFNIACGPGRKYSLRKIQNEIAKCDVRCANCHRRVTYSRRLKNANKLQTLQNVRGSPRG